MLETPLQTPPHPSPSRAMITVREVKCSTLLHRMNYGSVTEYTANLYRGCTHGCTYCYAPSLIHDERGWGSYVDVKANAPQVLERELRGLRRDTVFLSSASDPYQPVEAKYGLTRRCLRSLLRHRFPVSVLTRSPLVLRDLDLLKRFESVEVGMSITTVPVRQFEPGVPPLQRRMETLRTLAGAGIPTWVSLAPVIPGIVMVDLERLFEDLKGAGVSAVRFGLLRFAGYEESKRMFEASAGIELAAALAGWEELQERLTSLIRRYGMEPRDEVRRKKKDDDEEEVVGPGAGFASLDDFR
ncbi:MAG: radical SAM protein [Nitrososphaerales archaeon]